MGSNWSSKVSYHLHHFNDRPIGHHECEILKAGLEASESAKLWDSCDKNPGHEKFIPVQDFSDNPLINSMDDKQRGMLKLALDRTVRIRVERMSLQRPYYDEFFEYRGTNDLRLGTGYIVGDVKGPKHSKPCPCSQCYGKMSRNYWTFCVRTAHHVVYNTEEAKKSKVDLFYDDERCLLDGRMKTVLAVEVDWSSPDTDVCTMVCVTHNEKLAERIKSINTSRHPLVDSYVRPLSKPKKHTLFHRFGDSLIRARHDYALMVSHPHGQSKRIAVGKLRINETRLTNSVCVQYDTVTCPGCSGATVFPFNLDSWLSRPDPFLHQLYPWRVLVHAGTCYQTAQKSKKQVNYGSNWSYV